jgi:hypothetical protein
LVLALLGSQTGCQSPSRKAVFPIGIFGASEPADLREVRAAGFNWVVGSARPDFLEAAAREGLVVLAQPDGLGDTGILAADRHPALRSWYVADEPDMARLPPATVRAGIRELRRAGARKPTVLTLWGGREADHYGRLTDWLMIDRYPIPWMPLADFPKHLRLGRYAAGPGRPLIPVLQAFDWKAFPKSFPPRPGLRAPDHAELRAMAFLALLEGARGLMFYTYRSGEDRSWDLQQHPETWDAVLRVVREVRELEPLFLGQPGWRDFDVGYSDLSDSWNEVFDPAIQAATIHVRHGSASVPAGQYLVAVNTTRREIGWRFRWRKGGPDRVEERLSGRSLAPQPVWFTDRLGAYDVRVFGPLGPAH